MKEFNADKYITITGSIVSYPYSSRSSKSVSPSSLFEKEMFEERDRKNQEIIMFQADR